MHEKKSASALPVLILAGGAGRRMGDADKGLIRWQGKPLVEHVISRLDGQAGRIMISCNRNTERYATYSDHLLCDHRSGYQGPLAGLESAADKVPEPLLLVVPCDTPLLPSDLALQLTHALQATCGSTIAYAQSDGKDHYLCAVMRTEVLASLTPFLDAGGRAVRRWFATHDAIPVKFSNPDPFVNVNRLDP